MPGFNGSGSYVRYHDWTVDAGNAVNITASRMDTEHDGFATGLSTCITRDGQTTITADLPMAGFRHTGVGNAVARTQYAAAGQIQDAGLIYGGTAGGTANAITFNLTPAITAYATGMRVLFKAASANTGAATVAINGLTAKSIKLRSGGDVAANDILSGEMIVIAYDGTNFQLQRD